MNSMYLVIALRSAALAIGIAGQQRSADRLYAFADAIESGRATEEHMRLVAEKLKAREISDADWDDVERRMAEDQGRLHAPT